MKSLFQITVILLFGFTSLTAFADGFIIYGNDFSFMIKSPKGWVTDMKSGSSQGINVMLYPEGRSLNDTPVLMYGRVVAKQKGETLNFLMTADEKDFLTVCPSGSVKAREDLKTAGGNQTKTKDFVCPSKSYETVSFIDCEKTALLFVLHAGTAQDHALNIKNLESVVNSFFWTGSKVLKKNTDAHSQVP